MPLLAALLEPEMELTTPVESAQGACRKDDGHDIRGRHAFLLEILRQAANISRA